MLRLIVPTAALLLALPFSARYMPITGIDCTIASLLIDTEAPVDVLHDTAAYPFVA